jgi:hypothetical protein
VTRKIADVVLNGDALGGVLHNFEPMAVGDSEERIQVWLLSTGGLRN